MIPRLGQEVPAEVAGREEGRPHPKEVVEREHLRRDKKVTKIQKLALNPPLLLTPLQQLALPRARGQNT